MGEKKIRASSAISALPAPATIVRRFNIQCTSIEGLEASLQDQLSELLGDDIENYWIDYAVVEKPTSPTSVELAVAIALPKSVEGYAKAFEIAGLELRLLDVKYFALRNLFFPSTFRSGEATALIHVGCETTSLQIFSNDKSIDASYLSTGISRSQVGTRTVRLREEILRGIKLFSPRFVEGDLNRLVVTGAVAHDEKFRLALAETLGCPVELGDVPAAAGLHDHDLSCSSEEASDFAIAFGLLLRADELQ